jgi:hypothetical protein
MPCILRAVHPIKSLGVARFYAPASIQMDQEHILIEGLVDQNPIQNSPGREFAQSRLSRNVNITCIGRARLVQLYFLLVEVFHEVRDR